MQLKIERCLSKTDVWCGCCLLYTSTVTEQEIGLSTTNSVYRGSEIAVSYTHLLCIRQTLDPVYPAGGFLIVTG